MDFPLAQVQDLITILRSGQVTQNIGKVLTDAVAVVEWAATTFAAQAEPKFQAAGPVSLESAAHVPALSNEELANSLESLANEHQATGGNLMAFPVPIGMIVAALGQLLIKLAPVLG